MFNFLIPVKLISMAYRTISVKTPILIYLGEYYRRNTKDKKKNLWLQQYAIFILIEDFDMYNPICTYQVIIVT